VTTRQARKTNAALSMTALFSLSAWCAAALASSEVQVPHSELIAHGDTSSLHDILDENATSPTLQTLDSSDIVTLPSLADAGAETTESATEESKASAKASLGNTDMPDMATRLPGVSASDLPRFRRHMFRTDI